MPAKKQETAASQAAAPHEAGGGISNDVGGRIRNQRAYWTFIQHLVSMGALGGDIRVASEWEIRLKLEAEWSPFIKGVVSCCVIVP